MARVTWRGDEIKRKAERAARSAIDATMSAAIIRARSNHGPGAHALSRFESDSGELERGMRIVTNARTTPRGIAGRWGVQNVIYARRIELGFQGRDRSGRIIDASAYPFLRPAAQAEYPSLAGRLRRAYAHA